MTDEDPKTPEQLVRIFARCDRYPDDERGVMILAQGLARAAFRYQVEMETIVRMCAELSPVCPTDAHLMDAARLIHEDHERAAADRRRNQQDEWREQYGAPQPMPLGPVKVNHPKHWAHGMDWQEAIAKSHAAQMAMYDRLCKHFKSKDLSNVSLHDKYTAMVAMGYPLTFAQRQYL